MLSKQVKRVLIVGVTGFRNRGVEALVMTAVRNLRSRFEGCSISLASSDYEYDKNCVGPDASVLRDISGYYKLGRIHRSLRYAFGVRKPKAVKAYISAMDAADIVIATGGDIFSSDYGVGFLRRQLKLVAEAQRAGKKTVFLAHSIGPFATEEECEIVKPVLEASSLITVRESFSQKYLIDELGIDPARVHLTADVAFLMEPSSLERLQWIKQVVGLRKGVPLIAIAPSEGITSFETSTGINGHDEAWLRIIRHLLITTDADILLVPHVQDSNVKNDDNRIVERILEELQPSERIHAALGPYNAMDYKGLIGDADLLIGERMHACIAGLSQNIPTLTIGYSVKAVGIMFDLLGKDAEARGLIVPVQDLSEIDVLSKIDGIWMDRVEIKALLTAATPAIKIAAGENFRLLSAL